MARRYLSATNGWREDATADTHIGRTLTRPSFLPQRDLPSEFTPSSVIPIHGHGPGDERSREKQPAHGTLREREICIEVVSPKGSGESSVNYTESNDTGNESISVRPKRSPSKRSALIKSTEIRINTVEPQDVTVHMSLPLRDDLEGVLEDFSRMRRLGRFREALELFDDQLAHFVDNRYVLVQYGLCLYEGGQLVLLSELADKHRPISSPTDALHWCWIMLLLLTEVEPPEFRMQKDFNDIVSTILTMLSRSWPHLSSVEIQLLVLMYRRAPTKRWFGNMPGDWNSLYRHLLAEGMVWELSDVLHELVTYAPVLDVDLEQPIESALRLLLFPHERRPRDAQEDSFDRLCNDWEEEIEDESTSLALMNIFTTMALIYCKKQQQSDGRAQRYMALAGERAAKLLAQDDNTAMSRPYLRWTMAKILTGASDKILRENLVFRGFACGAVIMPESTFPDDVLPMYIPGLHEAGNAPEWQPKAMKNGGGSEQNKVRTVIRAAEELGDIEIQSACFCTMLLFGLEQPDIIVEKLTNIWTSAGNSKRLHELCLFRYMLVRTAAQREQLRLDLLCAGGMMALTLQQARYSILAALSPNGDERKTYERLALELANRQHLGRHDGRGHREGDRLRSRTTLHGAPMLPGYNRSRSPNPPHNRTLSCTGGSRQWPADQPLRDVASYVTPPGFEKGDEKRRSHTKDEIYGTSTNFNEPHRLSAKQSGLEAGPSQLEQARRTPPEHQPKGRRTTSLSPDDTHHSRDNGKKAKTRWGPRRTATVDDYEGSSDESMGRPKASHTLTGTSPRPSPHSTNVADHSCTEPRGSQRDQLLLEYRSKGQESSDSSSR